MGRPAYITGTFLLVILPVLINTTNAYTYIRDDISITCTTNVDQSKAICNYKSTTNESLFVTDARYNGISLPVSTISAYPDNNSLSAILLLVDTSDPGRQAVIEKNIEDIDRLLEAARPHHRIGLASFDKSLRLHVPVGMSYDKIREAAGKLRAIGKTTELYRSLLTAIALLGKINADRKSIYLFSDGLAEDRAYFHTDVVKAANKADISITGIGYPRSVSRSVALQTIRRLSEETGGLYMEADDTRKLPVDFLNRPFASADSGGVFETDLSSIIGLTDEDNIAVSFNLKSGNYKYSIMVPIGIGGITNARDDGPTGITGNMQRNINSNSTPDQPGDYWLWYAVPVFLIILLIITLVSIMYVFIKQNRKTTRIKTPNEEYKPYAYLVLQDETKKRFPITRTTWRIGRSKDNEMTLLDNSISRRHAEIYRDKGEIFTIFDLESLNGVFVNNEKINRKILNEGDIIEIGDTSLRFTLLSTDYTCDDITMMQNTKFPVTH